MPPIYKLQAAPLIKEWGNTRIAIELLVAKFDKMIAYDQIISAKVIAQLGEVSAGLTLLMKQLFYMDASELIQAAPIIAELNKIIGHNKPNPAVKTLSLKLKNTPQNMSACEQIEAAKVIAQFENPSNALRLISNQLKRMDQCELILAAPLVAQWGNPWVAVTLLTQNFSTMFSQNKIKAAQFIGQWGNPTHALNLLVEKMSTIAPIDLIEAGHVIEKYGNPTQAAELLATGLSRVSHPFIVDMIKAEIARLITKCDAAPDPTVILSIRNPSGDSVLTEDVIRIVCGKRGLHLDTTTIPWSIRVISV